VHARMHGECSCQTASAINIDRHSCEHSVRLCLWTHLQKVFPCQYQVAIYLHIIHIYIRTYVHTCIYVCMYVCMHRTNYLNVFIYELCVSNRLRGNYQSRIW
jgi:hypothetical protein